MRIGILYADGRNHVCLIEDEADVNPTIWGILDGFFEVVRPPLMPDALMLVDDCGALKDNRKLNRQASLIAGCPIFGNAILIGRKMTEDGEDFDDLPPIYLQRIEQHMLRRYFA